MARNNSQQFQAQFSLNGQQVKDELARIKKGIEDIDVAMKALDKDSQDYKEKMRNFADQRKALQEQQREMNLMSKVLKDLMKDLENASPNQLKQTMRDINKAIDSGAIKRGTKDWQEAMRVLAQCDQELKKINAEIAAAGEKSAFSKLRDQVSALVNNFKNLEKQSYSSLKKMRSEIQEIVNRQEPGSRGFQKWTQRLRDVDAQMKKVEADMKGINKENKEIESTHASGGFWSGLFKGGLAKAAGVLSSVVSAFVGIKKVVGDLVSLNMEFEQQMANLASVLGKSKNEIQALEKQALRLGEATMFTASQVAGLQVNLAKLGFNETQIQNSTRAILDFAAATGAALPEAASVAGSALRAFDLDATEMERVVSTMAVATTKSALDFEKLRTSISITFPVAKAFGFTIEDTTTLLGKLSDAGFEASSAATATRNILLNMANPAGKLAKTLGRTIKSVEDLAPALKELKDRNIDLAEAFALTDKRSVAAFTRFVQASDTLVDMKNSITDVDEELRKMVDTRMNTLQGSVTILSSAWQGLMLSFQNSTGPMKTVVDWLTKVTRSITRLISSLPENIDRETQSQIESQVREKKPFWKLALGRLGLDEKSAEEMDVMLTTYDNNLAKAKERIDEIQSKIKTAEDDLKKGVKNKDGKYLTKDQYEALLTAELVEAEVEKKRAEYFLENIEKVYNAKTNPDNKPYQKDPFASERRSAEGRIKAQQEAEVKAFAERMKAAKGNNEELEKIEKEHAQKMHDIAVEIYADIADKYRTLDPKVFDQFNNKVQQKNLELANKLTSIEQKYGKITEAEAKRRAKALEQEQKKREQLEKQLERGQKREERYFTQLEKVITKYDGIVEDAESWRNRQKRAVNALKNEKDALDRTYNDAYKLLLENEQAELALVQNNAQAKHEIEMRYLAERLRLNGEYQAAIEANETATNATITANSKETWKKVAGYIQDALSQAGDLFDGYSELVSSRYALQTAQVESRYDKEIEAAEKAGKDTTKLEKKKEEAVKAIQLQEAEAEYKASIAQAQMNAATASIRLWADNPWFVAAPLQAVLAAEVGMQMATLKNQYDAKKVALQGYYDGGYTGYSGNYRQVAGVTHEGEFVANHNTVNNPEIRPMLDMLDYAQKHNAEARLTQRDLAMAAAYRQGGYYGGGYVGSPTVNVSPNVTVQRDDNYARLTRILESIERDGIEAKAYPEGRFGWSTAMKRRNQIINNKTRI